MHAACVQLTCRHSLHAVLLRVPYQALHSKFVYICQKVCEVWPSLNWA